MTDPDINSTNNSEFQPAVELKAVSKIFGPFAALHDVTASFARGCLYALLGENGAGKTTLLRIVAGLARPTHGSVSALGSNDLRSVSARIGYMAHATLLYDELTARENLEYFLELYPSRQRRISKELLEMVGLEGVDSRRRVGQYSQGMRQRLSLARALISSPELLLLDEPFSNVDAKSITAMASLLGQVRDQGTTLIVITHQMEALARVADEWITMHAGTITDRKQSPHGAGMSSSRGQR